LGCQLLRRAADKRERRKPDGLERAQERKKKRETVFLFMFFWF
jgi:hypothetical protein